MLFDLPAKDKKIIFNDFPVTQLQREGDSAPIAVRVLPSFVGMVQTTEGIELGVDAFQMTFDYSSEIFETDKLSEGDTVFYLDKKFKIERIARDRTLNMYLCDLRQLKLEADAGIINRRADS